MAAEDSKFDFSKERIVELPHRAQVAFAVRCAKRVQPLYQHEDDDLQSMQAVEQAIDVAEQFAAGKVSAGDERLKEVARAAAAAADATATADADAAYAAGAAAYATDVAYTAAAGAARDAAVRAAIAGAAVDDEILQRMSEDLAALEEFCAVHGERYINLSPRSKCGKALGPLWPDDEPTWYSEAVAQVEKIKEDYHDPVALRARIRQLKGRVSIAENSRNDASEDPRVKVKLKETQETLHQKTLALDEVQSDLDKSQRDLERLQADQSRLTQTNQSLDDKLEKCQAKQNELQTALDQMNEKYHHLAPRGWGDWAASLKQPTGSMISFVFLAMITAFAILTIAEVNSRNQLLASTQHEIETLELELISTRPVALGLNGKGQSHSEALLEQLQQARTIDRRLLSLINTGATSTDHALPTIRVAALEKEAAEVDWWCSLSLITLVGFASSDFLVSMVVILAGTIGAIITVTRKEAPLTCGNFALGLSAGFIAFLIIRGGQDVFLVRSNGDTSSLNVYSCALFGLIVGLFTEDGYIVLRQIVDKFIKNFKRVIGADDCEPSEIKTLP